MVVVGYGERDVTEPLLTLNWQRKRVIHDGVDFVDGEGGQARPRRQRESLICGAGSYEWGDRQLTGFDDSCCVVVNLEG